MRIIAISDTHTYQSRMNHPIPDGDVIVHAGDFMSSGYNKLQYFPFLKWYSELPHKHKILIAGNHDRYTQMFEEEFKSDVRSLQNEIIYLRDESCLIDGVKFYGSPWQSWFWDWAWNFPNPRENKARARAHAENCWAQIPDDTQVLITHGQPYKINDRAPDGDDTGCKYLLERIKQLKDLKLYVGGHIHCEYGKKEIDGVTYINAAICNEDYIPENAPQIFDL